MKIKHLLISTALVSSLAVGAGAALAQGNNTPRGNPPGQGMEQPSNQPPGDFPGQPQGQAPRQGSGPMQNGFGDVDFSALMAEYTGLTIDELQTAMQDDQTLADLITANGQSVDDFVTAALEAVSANLDTAVAEGRISSEQAAEMKTQAETQITNWVNGEGGSGLMFGGPDRGLRGFGDVDFSALLAEYTGLTIDELQTAMQGEATLADLITANGQSVDDFVAAALEAVSTSLDAAVAEGRISSEQAAAMETQTQAQISDWVNGEGGPGFPVPMNPGAVGI